jgi:hypothetical protein
MRNRLVRVVLVTTVVVAACATQTQMLDTKQDMAMQTALTRGKFDLSCPDATAQILSREVTQPAVQSPWISGIQRAEYTVGVEGCGKRQTYLVLCPQGGESCFAGEGGGRMR